MKKYMSVVVALVFMSVLCGCSDTAVDTGIDGVKIKLEETAEEKTADYVGGRQITEYSSDGKEIKVTVYSADSDSMEAQLEMEEYTSYCNDGRVYRKMTKHYTDGELAETFVYQYDYNDSTTDATATVWYKRGEYTDSDSVKHTLEEPNGEIEITGIYSDYGEYYTSVQIRRIAEICRDKSVHTEYIAGKAIDTQYWYYPVETHTALPDYSKGEVIETSVPGIFIHIADSARKEEITTETGEKKIMYYDEQDRRIKAEEFDADGMIFRTNYTAYDEENRQYCRMEVYYESGQPYQTYIQKNDYHPGSLDVTVTYGIVWGNTYSSDSVEYTMEKPDSRLRITGSGYSGTENYFTVNITAITEYRTADFTKTAYYSDGKITDTVRTDYPNTDK